MLLEGYKFEQNNSTMALNYMLKKQKYIKPTFQNTTPSTKNKSFF